VVPKQITPGQLGKQNWDGAEEGPYFTRTHDTLLLLKDRLGNRSCGEGLRRGPGKGSVQIPAGHQLSHPTLKPSRKHDPDPGQGRLQTYTHREIASEAMYSGRLGAPILSNFNSFKCNGHILASGYCISIDLDLVS